MTRPQKIMRRWRDAFNAHDEAGIRSTCANDMLLEAPGDVRLEGVDATVEYTMGWLQAFPDAEMQVETEIADGDWVAQRFLFEGTHEAALEAPTGEIPATGRQLVGRGAQVARIEGDKVAEVYLYFDQIQLLTQLGLMQELATHA